MKIALDEKEKKARDLICLALDTDDREQILDIVEELKDMVGYFKLNFAFTNHGPSLIEEIKKKGGKVFLDLKFHDIPNTVAGYSRSAARLGIDIFNVHASGGKDMMLSAVKAAEDEAERGCTLRPKIIAVTILTSIDNATMNSQLNVKGDIEDHIMHLAELANDAGIDGIVCSAKDLEKIKDRLPEDFFYITPGIRLADAENDDQKRIMTPANAVKAGSSLLVIGRAITNAPDKRKAAYKILQDIASVL